jgi:hypothetical protein
MKTVKLELKPHYGDLTINGQEFVVRITDSVSGEHTDYGIEISPNMTADQFADALDVFIPVLRGETT